VFKGVGLDYLTEYIVQRLSVSLVLLVQPLLRSTAVLDQKQQESEHCYAVRGGYLADLRR